MKEKVEVNSGTISNLMLGEIKSLLFVVVEPDHVPLLVVPVANEESNHAWNIQSDDYPCILGIVSVPVIVQTIHTFRRLQSSIDTFLSQPIYRE